MMIEILGWIVVMSIMSALFAYIYWRFGIKAERDLAEMRKADSLASRTVLPKAL